MESFWKKLWRWVLGEPFSPPPAPESLSQPKPVPPAAPPPPKPPTRTIIAGAGDTLFSLAEKHHTTVQALISLNRINPRQPLRQGQRLLIPDFDAAEIVRSPAEPEFGSKPSADSGQPPVVSPKIEVSRPKSDVSSRQRSAVSHQPPAVTLPASRETTKQTGESPISNRQSPPTPAIAAEHMSRAALAIPAERERVLSLRETSARNAVVIDFKDEFGFLSHPVQSELAHTGGANRWTVDQLPALIESLHAKGITPIARIVAFKDKLIAPKMPDLAAHTADGNLWRTATGFFWLNPFDVTVWQYLLDVAATAARLGFAEIQFDSLRFPQPSPHGTANFSPPATPANRTAALTALLDAVRGHLPAGVALSVTVDGYACFRTDDFGTGENPAAFSRYVSAIAPLVFPAQFSRGIPGCADPLSNPAEAVEKTVRAARRRIGKNCDLRPWLQDFPWDAAGHRFDAAAVNAQIRAAIAAGADGFGVWRM